MKAKEGLSGLVFVLLAAMLCIMVSLAWAADPEFDRLQRQSPGKDWVTNGGDLTNQRYSTLKQINTSNVKQLKGAWMTRLKGSGLAGKYSLEATPLVKDGVMYVITGNDDVFALNAKTGEIIWSIGPASIRRSAPCAAVGLTAA
jgi:quinohemoprotein ethanol dehydrogenase